MSTIDLLLKGTPPIQTLLNYYNSAALGRWSVLAGTEPFSKTYPTLSVFVAWPDTDELIMLCEWYEEHCRAKGAL